jgi:hypothetical protein
MPIQELSGIQQYEIPSQPNENIYANATWRKNLKVQQEYEKKWQKNRLSRLTATFTNTNIDMPYVNPNDKVLNMRLVSTNNVYQYAQNMGLQDEQKQLFNYFNIANQQPPYKLQPYASYLSSVRF